MTLFLSPLLLPRPMLCGVLPVLCAGGVRVTLTPLPDVVAGAALGREVFGRGNSGWLSAAASAEHGVSIARVFHGVNVEGKSRS